MGRVNIVAVSLVGLVGCVPFHRAYEDIKTAQERYDIVYEEVREERGVVYSVTWDPRTMECRVLETLTFFSTIRIGREGVATELPDPFYKQRLLDEHCPDQG